MTQQQFERKVVKLRDVQLISYSKAKIKGNKFYYREVFVHCDNPHVVEMALGKNCLEKMIALLESKQ